MNICKYLDYAAIVYFEMIKELKATLGHRKSNCRSLEFPIGLLCYTRSPPLNSFR